MPCCTARINGLWFPGHLCPGLIEAELGGQICIPLEIFPVSRSEQSCVLVCRFRDRHLSPDEHVPKAVTGNRDFPIRASATRSIPVGFANSVGPVAATANPSGVQFWVARNGKITVASYTMILFRCTQVDSIVGSRRLAVLIGPMIVSRTLVRAELSWEERPCVPVGNAAPKFTYLNRCIDSSICGNV